MAIALYIMIICCTTYVGFGLAGYYSSREKLFYELVQFCERLKTDISFLLKPLDGILEKAASEYSPPLALIINGCREILASGAPVTAGALEERLRITCVSAEEKQLICGFFSILGKSDSRTQLESIENYRQRFLGVESACSGDKKKYAPMFKKLGFMSGVAICLFII